MFSLELCLRIRVMFVLMQVRDEIYSIGDRVHCAPMQTSKYNNCQLPESSFNDSKSKNKKNRGRDHRKQSWGCMVDYAAPSIVRGQWKDTSGKGDEFVFFFFFSPSIMEVLCIRIELVYYDYYCFENKKRKWINCYFY